MSYIVLARKYRPRTFHEVRGQNHTVRALINALDNDRLHHAYLLSGTRGVGKTTLGRILANCLNCKEGVSSTPCGKCACCIDFRHGNFIDLIEVDAASRTGVDDMRQLLENANLMPSMGRYRVYLIDEVHMLSASSFNALLKTLEEPPEHVKFILATTDPNKIPVTVLSRCLQFHLKNISYETIREQLEEVLKNEDVSTEPEALDLIARAADGSMRDALSIADQAISHGAGVLTTASVSEMLGTARVNEVAEILQLITVGDRNGVIKFTQELASRSVNYSDLLASLQRAIHAMSMYKVTERMTEESLLHSAQNLSPEWLQVAYQILLTGMRDLRYAPDHRIGFEMTMLRLIDFEPVSAYPASGPPVGEFIAQPGDSAKSPRMAEASSNSTLSSDSAQATQDVQENDIVPSKPNSRDSTTKQENSIEWLEIVKGLSVSLDVKQGLYKSELVESDEKNFTLRTEPTKTNKDFWTEHRVSEVEAALRRLRGQSSSVSMLYGELEGETPAQQLDRARNKEREHEKDLRNQRKRELQQRLDDAKTELEESAFIQSLQRDFGARIDKIRLH